MNDAPVCEREIEVDDVAMIAADEEEQRRLARTWGRPPGFIGWLRDTDHKAIGLRYIVTAFVFFGLAGLLALVMRVQLARPDNAIIGPDLYNQVFTTHGTTMMFLFAVPVMQGFGVYLVPLMVGTRNIGLPRLNAFGYWVYLVGGVLLWVGLFTNTGPDAGWFTYVPLAGPQFGPGKRVDVWAQMVTFTEMSAIAGGIALIVTILKHRAPGMSLDRMPLFVWATLFTSVMICFAMPSVMLSSTMLAMDRLVGTHFFNQAEGGDPLLWQHLFWYFAHPEVYIIFLPALGFVSSVMIPFARTKIVGYPAMVLSMATTAFVGFGVWVHHMFTTGLPQLGQSYFTASSMLITIPTGIQFFCWIATIWRGRLRPRVPMLYILAFIATFVIGGLTGVMAASVPLDLQLHDSFFVVAHLHYVLIGGAVFPLLGAVAYWFPKATGRMMNETLGRIAFALVFGGFNLGFFPMHQLGLHGMPRRIYTYAADTGWGGLNLFATIGTGVLALGLVLYFVDVVVSARRGLPAGDNPWDSDGLEWGTCSPPPPHNFLHMPTVRGLYPLWTKAADQPVVAGLRGDRPDILVTRVMDAEPDHRTELPGHSITPLLTALVSGVMFIVSIFTPWGIVIGSVLLVIVLCAMLWPWHPHREEIVKGPP